MNQDEQKVLNALSTQFEKQICELNDDEFPSLVMKKIRRNEGFRRLLFVAAPLGVFSLLIATNVLPLMAIISQPIDIELTVWVGIVNLLVCSSIAIAHTD